MLRKVIVTRAVGLGIIFAVVTIPSAIAGETGMQELSEKISNLTKAFQKQADKTDEALQNQDERLKKVEAQITRLIPKDNGNSPAPQTTRVVHIHRHYYSPRYWCPPPWWGPWY